MHRYRIVAQISLILSILNLVLAAPIVVPEIHEARDDETVVEADVAAMPKSTSPPSSPDTMASPQHSSDGSTTSGYSAPYLSSDSSDSSYSWLLDRPPRPSPNFPASSMLHESASPQISSSGSPEALPMWQGRPVSSSSGSPQNTGSDRAATETYSPPGQLTPSHHSDEPMSTPYSLASGGSVPSHHSMSEALAPSHDLTSDGLSPSPSSPPTETPPDNTEFFEKNMMKKLGIAAGVIIVGGTIGGIVGSQCI